MNWADSRRHFAGSRDGSSSRKVSEWFAMEECRAKRPDRRFDHWAGVAGLTATRGLAKARRRVLIVEARDRLGGRIHTLHQSDQTIELGAEFVHGKPPEFWKALHDAKLDPYQVEDEHWELDRGTLQLLKDFEEKLGPVFKEMNKSPGVTFAEFARRRCHDSRAKEAMPFVKMYVEGFDAADTERIGTHALLHAQEESDKVNGDLMFRVPGGYERLVNSLAANLKSHEVEIRMNTRVSELRRGPGEVIAETRSADSSAAETIRAQQAVITVSLGVLKASPNDIGGIRFTPDLPEAKRDAIARLEMGHVFKMFLKIREPLWNKLSRFTPTDPKRDERMIFFHGPGLAVPTWWTVPPSDSHWLVGWAGGPAASALSKLRETNGETAVFQRGIECLATLLQVPVSTIEVSVEDKRAADWQADPFTRGAYSYVPPNGLNLPKELGKPVDGVLFFAGEATDSVGVGGTVDAAYDSGMRVVKEILCSTGR